MWKLVVCLALVSGATSARVDPTPNFLYDLEVDAPPAFCKVMKNGEKLTSDGKSTYDLGFSSFTGNIRKDDLVFSVSEVSEYDKFNPITASVDLVSDQLQWPNEVDQVPDGVFEHRVWTVASGFFLAGKDNGSIALIEVEEGHAGHEELVTISPFDEKPWFYHRVMWQDMNRDGHLDAVTARAWGAGDASEESQLIWLENPGDEHISPNWNMHILHEGKVDIAFTFHQLPLDDGTMTNVIVSSGFWSEELALIWSATNDWTDSASIQYMVVDTYGWYFDVEVEDINNDGRMDLLTTTWSQLKSPGAVLAYEIPDDWKTPSAWGPRHILMDGYFEFPIPGKGSPGSAISFWPTEQMKKENHKPYIVVSGDDDGNFFVLTANSDEDTSDWSYTQTKIYQQKVGTVGAMTVADVNEDGYAEIFLPAYQNSFIRVLTYEP